MDMYIFTFSNLFKKIMKPLSILLIILITVPVWAGEIEGVAAHLDDGTATSTGRIDWDDYDSPIVIEHAGSEYTCPIHGSLEWDETIEISFEDAPEFDVDVCLKCIAEFMKDTFPQVEMIEGE